MNRFHRRSISLWVWIALAANDVCAAPPVERLDVVVFNLQRKPVAALRIRLTEELAHSCIGGTWKKVVIESWSTEDSSFLPAADALSYEFDGKTLTIGRNGICDGYLRLGGELTLHGISGDYTTFGLGGARKLGVFTAEIVK